MVFRSFPPFLFHPLVEVSYSSGWSLKCTVKGMIWTPGPPASSSHSHCSHYRHQHTQPLPRNLKSVETRNWCLRSAHIEKLGWNIFQQQLKRKSEAYAEDELQVLGRKHSSCPQLIKLERARVSYWWARLVQNHAICSAQSLMPWLSSKRFLTHRLFSVRRQTFGGLRARCM